MAETQRDHWWFRARRSILSTVLAGLRLPSPARVLEIGCGTGGNLGMLRAFGPTVAMEMDDYALEIAAAQGGADVRKGWLPDAVPVAGPFDLVCLFDVLEHCEDDVASLQAVRSLLAPGGRVVLTAPAYQWLFGAHDRAHHHFRRYTTDAIRDAAYRAGLRVHRIGYFNTLLFPLVVVRRMAARLGLGADDEDARTPPPLLNSALEKLFGLERLVVPRLLFPFGTSVIAVLGRGD